MQKIVLPRNVRAKAVAAGTGYYWAAPLYWKKQAEAIGRKWPFESQPLGTDLGQADLDRAAAVYNAQFDEWRDGGGRLATRIRRYAAQGTVEWLFETYLGSEIFRRRVAERSRADYRRLFDMIAAIKTKDGSTFGKQPLLGVSPAAAGKIYDKILEETVDDTATALARIENPRAAPVMTGKYRTGEKAVMYCKTAWRLMQPHYPREFPREVPNPWVGVQLVTRTPETKAAHDRDAVYAFAWKAVEMGMPEQAAAAVICFEWLQRPENVIGGYVRWGDYLPGRRIRIQHHKTGEMVQHPLSETTPEGLVVQFYEEAESVLKALPRRGLSMILRPEGTLYEATRFAQLVRKVADAAGLPKTFSLDACRHGGMTELEEAELTDGQGRALSAHRSRAYEGYAKRTEKRMLAATRRRHAYVVGGI